MDKDKAESYGWGCGCTCGIVIVIFAIIAFPTAIFPIWIEAAQNIEIPGFEPTLLLGLISLLGTLIVISYHNKFKKKN